MSEDTDSAKTASQSPVTPPNKELGPAGEVQPHVKGDGAKKVDKLTYTDTMADVILVSKQGREFYVYSYFLKANSVWFRTQPTENTKPITIDTPTAILKLFLDIIHHRHLPDLALWSNRVALFRLADQYGCPGIVQRVLASLHHSLKRNPWEIFVIASQRGKTSLAKAALRAMDDKGAIVPAPEIGSLTPELTARVSLPYLLGLFNAIISLTTHGENPSWQGVADHFTPVKGNVMIKA